MTQMKILGKTFVLIAFMHNICCSKICFFFVNKDTLLLHYSKNCSNLTASLDSYLTCTRKSIK